MIDNNISQFAILAAIAPIVAFWGQVKSGFGKIVSLVIKSDYVVSSPEFINYIFQNSKELNIGSERYSFYYCYNKESDINRTYYFSSKKSYILFFKNWNPIILSGDSFNCKITYIRFLFNLKSILAYCSDLNYKNQESTTDKLFSYFSVQEIFGELGDRNKDRNKEYSSNQLVESKSPAQSQESWFFSDLISRHFNILNFLFDKSKLLPNKPLTEKSKYYFTPTGNYLFNQISTFLSLESFYSQRGIPFRRGYGLHSKPGYGKTSLIIEIARKIGLPVYKIDLSSFSNKELQTKINSLSGYGILLFEDIDTIFDGRKNIVSQDRGGVSFDFFINLIGGAIPLSQKIIFITTNNIDKLDKALIRPGRLDEVIELENLPIEGKKHVASIILDKWPELIEDTVNNGAEDTTAEFENRCIQIALKKIWNK